MDKLGAREGICQYGKVDYTNKDEIGRSATFGNGHTSKDGKIIEIMLYINI